jgi:hypothetical protein
MGKRGGFYLAVLFCYLDLTEVLASSMKVKKEVFTWLRCSATWILLEFWPAHERGKEEAFIWQCCSATWTLLKFSTAHGRGKMRCLPGCAILLLGSYWSFGPRKGKRGGFYLAVLFCYLDLTEVFASPCTEGEKGGFYLAVLFCYLDLTGVLTSPRKGKRGGFFLEILLCYLDLTEVLASPRKGDRRGFYLAALFCYLDLTEVLASLGRGRGSLILLPVVTLKV